MMYIAGSHFVGKKVKRAARLYKPTCVHTYLGLFLEGAGNTVTVVAIKRV